MRRMQSDTCYKCGKIGHWSWYCPLNISSTTSPDHNLAHRMETDTCYECGKVGHWSWYCPLKSSNTNKSSSLSPYHGPSNIQRILQQISLNQFSEGCSQSNKNDNNLIGNVNDLGEKPDDLLLKIESMTINDDNSRKEKQNDDGLLTSQVADHDQLQVANLVVSSSEEADETEPFQRDASFGIGTTFFSKNMLLSL